MSFALRILTHEPVYWKEGLPDDLQIQRLPGSKAISTEGNFGSICFQEYRTKNYVIHLNVLNLLQNCVIRSINKAAGLCTRFILKGETQIADFADSMDFADGTDSNKLRQNQFLLSDNQGKAVTTKYDSSKHVIFETFFSKKFLHPFQSLLTSDRMTNDHSHWGNMETVDIINSIIRCRYEGEAQRHFFDNRVSELLLNYLHLSNTISIEEKEPSEAEFKAVYTAEELINEDLSRHFSIPELARMVSLNELRFKQLFKKMFRTGPYEYLTQKRIQHGAELLEAGFSIKETAAAVGYRPSDFTVAFRKYFGINPSSVRKNKQ